MNERKGALHTSQETDTKECGVFLQHKKTKDWLAKRPKEGGRKEGQKEKGHDYKQGDGGQGRDGSESPRHLNIRQGGQPKLCQEIEEPC